MSEITSPPPPPNPIIIDELLTRRVAPTMGQKVLPYVTLMILIVLSLLAWLHFESTVEQRERQRFDEHVNAMVLSIRERLATYEMIMRGGAGLFISSIEVTREEWRNYVSYRQIQTLFPGIQALCLAKIVRPEDLTRHIQEIKTEGFLDYAIRPSGERPAYCPIIFPEPFDALNQQVLGYDILSEPVRRLACERACDVGAAAVSGQVTLVLTSGVKPMSGFLMCLPIYKKEVSIKTVEERRAALWGYVVSAFHMAALMKGIFPDSNHEIEFEVFDGTEASVTTLMFDTHHSSADCSRAMFAARKALDLFGTQWTLMFHTTPVFEAQAVDRLPKTLLAAGIAISLMIFLFLMMLKGSGDRAFAIARDTTLELEEYRIWLDTIIETALDAIIVMDERGRISLWNKAATRIFGFSSEEAMGKDLHKLIAPAHCYEEFRRAFQKFGETGEGPILGGLRELVGLRKGGEEFPLEISLSALRRNGGFGAVGVVRDITARKKIESQLASERKRFFLIVETLPAFVALIGPDHSIPYVNRQFRERFGDPAGHPCHEILASNKCHRDGCRTCEVFRTGLPVSWEWTGPNGCIYQIYDYPYNDSDESSLVLELGLDITDQQQAERERVARKAADAANHQKSMFLSNMSHEIRTPMNAILGFAQILERDSGLSPKQREQIGSINRSGQHLLGLINDILDMSKIEAGMNALKPVAFCLRDLIADLEMMFRSRAEAKNLQLLVECDASVPYYVLADEGKVRQVLINLLGNAIKFTNAGGVSMRVRAEPAPFSTSENGKTLRLTVEVEDSGPGIPETDLTQIFTPFGQGEAGVHAGGTGLGLPISRRLAEMMGGGITVETEIGRGSCFRFDMLLEPSATTVTEKRPAPRLVIGLAPGTDPLRILVVDDQPTNRDLLCDLLRPLGFEIRQAENGSEALTIFHEWAPHAVLMDMRMPVMDGYEATRQIKATPKGHDTPVIAVTASAFKDSEDQVRATGVSAYLRKPFRPEELWDALGNCLGLRYVYADESPAPDKRVSPAQVLSVDPARVAALPADLLQVMRQSVTEGDMTRLAELIDQVESLDANTAQGLRAMADRYDYRRLSDLFGIGGNDDA